MRMRLACRKNRESTRFATRVLFPFALLSLLLVTIITGCGSTAGSALDLIPDDVQEIAIGDAEDLLTGDFFIGNRDGIKDSWDDILGEVIKSLDDVENVVLVSGDDGELIILDGEFDFDHIGDIADDEGLDDEEYRGYELWTSPSSTSLAFLKESGYLLMGDEGAVKNVLRSLNRGRGFLLEDEESAVRHVLMKIEKGQITQVIEGCNGLGVHSCEAVGIAFSRGGDIVPPNLTLTFLFLYQSDRDAEEQIDELEESVEWFLEDEGIEIENVILEGNFVTIVAGVDEDNLGELSEPTPTPTATRAPDSSAAVPGEFYFRATSAEHIDWGTRGSGYASDPPTSGQHYSVPGQAPTNWGAYSSPIQDEILIHNMEHGGIIAYYLPSAPPAEIEQLRKFIMNQQGYPRGFVMAPRFRLPATITLVAWEYYLPVFRYDESTMQAFIDAHYDRGPETLDGTVR